MRYSVILFFLTFYLQFTAGQPEWNESDFRSMSNQERYRYVHDYSYWKIRSGKEQSDLLKQMLLTAESKKDRPSVLAIKYYICRISGNSGFEMPGNKTVKQLLTEIKEEAGKKGLEVEEIVAQHYLVNIRRVLNDLSLEQQYVENQRTFEQMSDLGLDKFKDYQVDGIMFNLAYFMWELEDFENAYHYLSVAEKYIYADEPGAYFYTQILSYLQTYWKQKQDLNKSIAYTQQILQFHENYQFEDPANHWWSRFWRGFSNIEMAALLIDQGKIAESEPYADIGYSLSKAEDTTTNVVPFQAEYDALMVLIPVKLKLGKISEAGELLKRADFIKAKLEPLGQLDYFKPLKLYQHFSAYNEKRGDAAAALRYIHLAQELQDSLERRNDAHKLAQAQQRHDALKFSEKLEMVENEKQLQKLLRNASIVILLLVIALAYGNYHRLQYLRKQKEAELYAAMKELEALTISFREKSEMLENLNRENEKLEAAGQHSEFLFQLANSTILTEEDWTKFRLVFEKVHPGFIAEQKQNYPELTPAETRLLVLEKLGLETSEIANMLGVNRNTVNQTRHRLRKKMEYS